MTSENILTRAARLKGWNQDVTDVVKTTTADLLGTWDIKRSKLTRKDVFHKLEKVSSCGGVLELRSPVDRETGEMGELKLHNANFCCQYAICPICAARIQSRRQTSLKEPIQEFSKRYPFAYMVTATVKDGENLGERFGHLVQSWQKFRRMGQKRPIKRKGVTVGYRRGSGEFGRVCAALSHVEIKRGARSGQWHPHLHALVFTDSPLDYSVWKDEELKRGEKVAKYPIDFGGKKVASSRISRQWLKASNDSMGIDVRPLRMRKTDKAHGRTLAEAVWHQAREVLKYATKFNSKPEADQAALMGPDYVTVMDVSYCRRLFNSYGAFRGLAALENEMVEPEDLLDVQESAVYSIRWNPEGRTYWDLRPEEKPLFDNSDPIRSEERRELITKVNRIQGHYRKRRTRLMSVRPWFARCDKLEEWERWVDKNTKECRARIWEERENYRMGDCNYWAATWKSREEEAHEVLSYWDRYPDPEVGLVESFRWVILNPPGTNRIYSNHVPI